MCRNFQHLACARALIPSFTRLVFDWAKNVPYTVFPGAGRITLRFEAAARPDFAALTRVAPPWVKEADWRVENNGLTIDFDTDAASAYHDFRDGTHVVLDILAPKTDAAAYNPPGGNKGTAPVELAAAQAQAIADAAAKVNDKPAEATKAARATDATGCGSRSDITCDTHNTGTNHRRNTRARQHPTAKGPTRSAPRKAPPSPFPALPATASPPSFAA